MPSRWKGQRCPPTIIDLIEKKTTTAFPDGDRGGELILRELLQVADIDYVAFPPRGKSVEDLARKEVIKALRNKVPVEYIRDQFMEPSGREQEEEERPVRTEATHEGTPCPGAPGAGCRG